MDALKWCHIYVSLSYVHPSVVTMCPHSVSRGPCWVLMVVVSFSAVLGPCIGIVIHHLITGQLAVTAKKILKRARGQL